MDASQLDVRTKTTVEEGLDTFEDKPARVMMVDYQPGNGTRYCLSIVDTSSFSSGVNFWLGFEGNGWVVTDLNAHRSMMVNSGGYLSAGYVAEKLKCCAADAYVLAELLGKLLGRDHEKAGP
jgi:hypothetical protein